MYLQMATLSIGIPVFNGGCFIEGAIRSVLTQSLHDIEIIISDNASTDDTAEICLKFAAIDGRIKYFRQESTMSAGSNFNFVVEAASGEFFGWQAHDDEMEPEFCMIAQKYLQDHPSVVCISGDFHNIDSNGLIIDDVKLSDIRGELPWEERIRLFFHQSKSSKAYMCIYGLFRRRLLLDILYKIKVGPTLTNMELPILSRLATVGEIASVPFVLRRYRRHLDSASHAECRTTAASGWRGKFLNFYGRLWYKHDQLRVLLESSLSWNLKLSIISTVILYHLRRIITLLASRCSVATRN